MRKILLFGTMLGVAGTALAFGGVFNHGSKSTTYKGGVDAIGVHFGGEKKTSDSQPEEAEETCPAEKQCGDYCCGEGHTCQEGLCCDENGNCCDSSGYSSATGECCASDEKVFVSYYEGNNIVETDCCSGEVVVAESDGDAVYYSCCSNPFNIDGISGCCEKDEIAYCTVGIEGSCQYASCCAGDVSCVAKNEEGECIKRGCCPYGKLAWGDKCTVEGCEFGPWEDQEYFCCDPEHRYEKSNGGYGCCGKTNWSDQDECPE